jgi:hypothetical protein
MPNASTLTNIKSAMTSRTIFMFMLQTHEHVHGSWAMAATEPPKRNGPREEALSVPGLSLQRVRVPPLQDVLRVPA